VQDIEGIVPTFFVQDVARAAEWYARVLGFKTAFVVAEPGEVATYCGVELGPATIHLAQREPDTSGVGSRGACYLRLRSGVDSYVAQVEATGQRLTSRLKDHDYGMREATVRDLDGNDIYIGQALEPHLEANR
jgi:uncharacterized glyoxalase superfamily protein PhnB